jgi:hypothetical protein
MRYARLSIGKGFRPGRSFLYYSQRLVTIPGLRRAVIALIGAGVRLSRPLRPLMPAPTAAQQQTASCLAIQGYAPLGPLFNQQQCDDIHAFIASITLTDRDNSRAPFNVENLPVDVRIGEYALEDVVRCPHILALANSPELIGLAARFIGCKPTISGLRLRWSFPVAEGESILQKFHRDAEDWRYFKVMVYLTDVDGTAGPHVFVRGSHLTAASMRIYYRSDEEVKRRYGADNLLEIPGAAGSGFAVDTSGLHKGTAPTGKARLLLQLQYSLLPCYAYEYEPVDYAGGLALDPYINRLIVKH